MKTVDKVRKLKDLYDEMRVLFPNSHITLFVHDVPSLDTVVDFGWELEPQFTPGNRSVYLTAKYKLEKSDITLFSEEQALMAEEVEDE